MEKELNVVYIGGSTFPLGYAMTKRWRYMVDYMNMHGIQSHVMVCHYKIEGTFDNPQKGNYGMADYIDIRHLFAERKILSFYRVGKKQLKEWFNPNKKNIMIFSTNLSFWLLPFYKYAKKIGYKMVFDQVETSMKKSGKMRFRRRINILLSESVSRYAYKGASSFVISSALWWQNHEMHPNMPLCLLPNSTVDLKNPAKKTFNAPIKVLYSGTFASKDGVSYLIDGVIGAHNRGCNVELILLGKGQPWDMKVLEKVKDYPWVKYLGFVSDEELIDNIQQADVLCMTRTNSIFANYGFPFKLSEYLATGNILLASRIGDVERYVKDKESAYLVSPESANDIANALCYIESHPIEAKIVAENGYKVMKMHFSIEHVGDIFVKFLNQI